MRKKEERKRENWEEKEKKLEKVGIDSAAAVLESVKSKKSKKPTSWRRATFSYSSVGQINFNFATVFNKITAKEMIEVKQMRLISTNFNFVPPCAFRVIRWTWSDEGILSSRYHKRSHRTVWVARHHHRSWSTTAMFGRWRCDQFSK